MGKFPQGAIFWRALSVELDVAEGLTVVSDKINTH